jgi:hypothetical protein
MKLHPISKREINKENQFKFWNRLLERAVSETETRDLANPM